MAEVVGFSFGNLQAVGSSTGWRDDEKQGDTDKISGG